MALEGNIKVKTEQLRAAADAVTTKLSNMKTELDEMNRIINDTKTYWNGEAAEQKRSTYQKLSKEAEKVHTQLSDYPKNLLAIAGVYETTESENTEEAQTLNTNIIV